MVLVLVFEEAELLGRWVAADVEVLGAVVKLRRSAAGVEKKMKLAAVTRVAHVAESWEALEVLEARMALAGSRPTGSGMSEVELGRAPSWSPHRLGLGLRLGLWPGRPP